MVLGKLYWTAVLPGVGKCRRTVQGGTLKCLGMMLNYRDLDHVYLEGTLWPFCAVVPLCNSTLTQCKLVTVSTRCNGRASKTAEISPVTHNMLMFSIVWPFQESILLWSILIQRIYVLACIVRQLKTFENVGLLCDWIYVCGFWCLTITTCGN